MSECSKVTMTYSASYIFVGIKYWLTGKTSMSCKNFAETDTNASCGHSWNQIIEVQLIKAGNLRDLTLKVDPTGEKHRTTFNWRLARSMKNFQQFSRVSKIPAPFTWIRVLWVTLNSIKENVVIPYSERYLISNTTDDIFHFVFWKQISYFSRG